MSISPESSSQSIFSRYAGRAILAIVLSVCLVALLRECARIPGRAAREIANAFRSALGVEPQVTVNQTIIINQTSPIAEFAVLSRDQSVELDYHHEITLFNRPLGMTAKDVRIRAAFRIKAGFDLSQPFRVNINSPSGRVDADLPPAKILSIEQVGEFTTTENSGWFNSVTPEERLRLLASLQQQARVSAEKSDLLPRAEEEAASRIRQIVEKNGQTIQFHFRENL